MNDFNKVTRDLFLQKYERYLPTAFDESMTLLEKLNRVIEMIIRYGDLSDEMVDYLNKFKNEFDEKLHDNINAAVKAMINKFLNDGVFENIINNNLISNFKKEFEQTETNDVISKITKYPNIQINTVNNGRIIYVTLFDNFGNQITHQFGYNGAVSLDEYDQYLIHTRTWEGSYELDYKEYQKTSVDDLKTFGSFTPGAENIARYTTTIGDTFEQDVTIENNGDAIMLNFFANNKGGLWKVELLNSELDSVNLSTYTNSDVNKQVYTPFTDLPKGSYKLKGTFMGVDPKNPVENPRGWIGNTKHVVVRKARKHAVTNNTDSNLIKYPSNLEFAYNFKDKVDSEYVFAPFHQKIVSYENQPIKFYDDDGIIDFNTFDGDTRYYVKGSFKIVQDINVRYNPNDKKLMNIKTIHQINNNGTIDVEGNMKVLEDIYMNNSYVIMGVGKSSLFNKIVTGYDNVYNNTSNEWLASNSNEFLPESDECRNYTFISSSKKNVAIGIRFNNIKKTLRKYEDNKDLPQLRTYIQHRDEKITKIYSKLFNSEDNLVKKGYSHNFSGTYFFTNQFNVYDLLI